MNFFELNSDNWWERVTGTKKPRYRPESYSPEKPTLRHLSREELYEIYHNDLERWHKIQKSCFDKPCNFNKLEWKLNYSLEAVRFRGTEIEGKDYLIVEIKGFHEEKFEENWLFNNVFPGGILEFPQYNFVRQDKIRWIAKKIFEWVIANGHFPIQLEEAHL